VQKGEGKNHLHYIKKLIRQLPEINQAVLKYLVAFLIRVEKFSAENKMAIYNLATVFAPNLLAPRDKNMLQMVEDTPLVHGLVNSLIKDFDFIFTVNNHPHLFFFFF